MPPLLAKYQASTGWILPKSLPDDRYRTTAFAIRDKLFVQLRTFSRNQSRFQSLGVCSPSAALQGFL